MYPMDALVACNLARQKPLSDSVQPGTPGALLVRLALCLAAIMVLAGAVHATEAAAPSMAHVASR